jgi:hypothetical protein
MNWKAFFLLPPLDGRDSSSEIGSDLLPRIQSIGWRLGRSGLDRAVE